MQEVSSLGVYWLKAERCDQPILDGLGKCCQRHCPQSAPDPLSRFQAYKDLARWGHTLSLLTKDALGGGSLGMLVCCLAPGEKFEADTINSLKYVAQDIRMRADTVASP